MTFVNTIAKLTKSCTVRFSVNKLYFILTDKVANGGVGMWCELNQSFFFDEYQMEGVSADQNEIYLEVVPENLSRALKSAQNAKSVKIKLKNKQCPCLTVAVELVTISQPLAVTTTRYLPSRHVWKDGVQGVNSSKPLCLLTLPALRAPSYASLGPLNCTHPFRLYAATTKVIGRFRNPSKCIAPQCRSLTEYT
uniref:Checkpoint protein HUS1 n=1 Tax=Leptobrachium leishanense TaxID=445787 RepID=A0A8C5WGZ6_9ANUR